MQRLLLALGVSDAPAVPSAGKPTERGNQAWGRAPIFACSFSEDLGKAETSCGTKSPRGRDFTDTW